MTSDTRKRWLLSLTAIMLSGCGSLKLSDGAPPFDIDVSQIPDAVPRIESFSKTVNPESYDVNGKRYFVKSDNTNHVETGIASWYGTKFHGRNTSSGEIYDMLAMTAAHKTLRLPCYAEITNLDNQRKIIVRINDRGPFSDGRIIDLSYAAAAKLGMLKKGTANISLKVITPKLASDKPQVLTLKRQALIDTYFEPVKNTSNIKVISPSTSAIFLQVGAFKDKPNADRLRDKLLAMSSASIHISKSEHKQNTLYKVSIGPLGSTQAAVSLAEKLSTLGLEATRVTQQ